ncbi:MAG: hypothetical protein QOG38_2949 [Hyphomicrobiales bacterium]|jgi:Spy/CpxP family protein refolding chaperone|nr:hypothetical protein [Hyphomicrobiales bacterium]
MEESIARLRGVTAPLALMATGLLALSAICWCLAGAAAAPANTRTLPIVAAPPADGGLARICSAYANEAVMQVVGATRACGPQQGELWGTAAAGHIQWCRSATAEQRAERTAARRSRIETCQRDREAYARIVGRARPDALVRACAEYDKFFPAGLHAADCKARVIAADEREWVLTRSKAQFTRGESAGAQFEAYLKQFPDGLHAAEARTAIKDVQAFAAAQKADTEAALDAYLKEFPNGLYANVAKLMLPGIRQREKFRADAALADLRKACTVYGIQAVAFARDNAKEACGFTGFRWTTDLKSHIDWCMSVTPEERTKEVIERTAEIMACTAPRREREAWARALKKNSIESFAEYLGNWPEGANESAAKANLARLCDALWPKAKGLGVWADLTRFAYGDCKSSQFSAEALALREAKDEEAWLRAQAAATAKPYQDYLVATGGDEDGNSSEGKYLTEAQHRLRDLAAFARVERYAGNNPEAYRQYLLHYPEGLKAEVARQRCRCQEP